MTNRVAGKIKLQSVDELLGVPEISGTQEIEIARIHEFPNHPFKVLDDEKIWEILQTPKWKIHYTNGTTKEIDATLTFKTPGKTVE